MNRSGRRRGREWPTLTDERRATAALSTEQREGSGSEGEGADMETGRRRKAYRGSSLGFGGLAC